jgi:hypothetical protein
MNGIAVSRRWYVEMTAVTRSAAIGVWHITIYCMNIWLNTHSKKHEQRLISRQKRHK